MRGTWLIAAALTALLWAGCKTKPQVVMVPQAGTWPHVQCPPGDDVTAATRLSEIITWAEADGTPKALEAKGLAEVCATEHTGANEIHSHKVFQAWTLANQVVTNPGMPPHEKEQHWQACADELTHESDGS